jgi:uncharacterized membrane protein YhaH (DUF805 family)
MYAAESENRSRFSLIWHTLFSCKGRVARLRYFLNCIYVLLLGFVFLLVTMLPAALLMEMLRIRSEAIFNVLVVMTYILVLWGSTCQAVKRFHDLEHSGLCVLLTVIPLVGIVVGFYVMLAPGTKGPNRYGNDPLEGGLEITKKDLEAFD